MPEAIISDASCFIILSKVGEIELLRKTYESVITTSVVAAESACRRRSHETGRGMTGMNFTESTSYLLSLGNEVSAMKLGLENIRKLLAALGDPQNNYLKVQIAGTNGKGSVCAFLDSICLNAGIKTGLYTSPHLVSITERIKIGGREITEADFARHATTIRAMSEKMYSAAELESIPTFFEQVTAMALSYFAEKKIELAILETGLGGRLDATTAANAEIVAITQIDIDHQEYLGESLAEIAAEKAAVIRSGVKAVIARQSKEVERVIEGRCREVGVEPIWASDEYLIRRDREIAPMLYGTFRTERSNYAHIDMLGMLGAHQFQNASIAISVAELLQDSGFDITTDNICIGLETATHPGRLEYQGNFLFDGAHNVAGANALAEYLDEFVPRPITLVFGTMKGKDVAGITALLFKKAERVILTRPKNSRAMTAAEIASFVPPEFDGDRLVLTETVEEALTLAPETVGKDGLILVTGSLYLVGEARRILNKIQLAEE